MNLKHTSAVLFLVSTTVFPNSFFAIKLVLLFLFLLIHLLHNYANNKLIVYPKLIMFYLLFSIAAVFWSLIGLFKDGDITGIMECIRLYVAWSMVFIVIFTLLRSNEGHSLLHISMILSGILISIINFIALYDFYDNIWFISEGIREEINFGFAISDGYTRMESVNMTMLFIIVPYLLSIQFRRDAVKQNTPLTKISLVLSLVLAILSGRRALWLCIAFTPIMVGGLFCISGSLNFLKRGGALFIKTYICICAVLLGFYIFSPSIAENIGFMNHLSSAFSPEDPRSIQKGYLINSFFESPYIGSGFGAYAGIPRSEDPWKYELTYHKMLFNLGVVGVIYLVTLVSIYLLRVVSSLKRYKSEAYIPFGIIISWFSLLIGAYSNPYFGAFGYMFYFGMLPYLSTYD